MIPSQITTFINAIENSAGADIKQRLSQLLLNPQVTNFMKSNEYLNEERKTFIYRATEKNNLTALAQLLRNNTFNADKGKLFNDLPRIEQSPLIKAIIDKNLDAVKILMAKCKLNEESVSEFISVTEYTKRFPLELACQLEQKEIFVELAKKTDVKTMQAALENNKIPNDRKELIKKTLAAREQVLATGTIDFTGNSSPRIEKAKIISSSKVKETLPSHPMLAVVERIKASTQTNPIFNSTLIDFRSLDLEEQFAAIDTEMNRAKNQLNLLEQQQQAIKNKGKEEVNENEGFEKVKITDKDFGLETFEVYENSSERKPILRAEVKDNICKIELLSNKLNLQLPDLSKYSQVFIVGADTDLKLNLKSKCITDLKIEAKKIKFTRDSMVVAKSFEAKADTTILAGQIIVDDLKSSGQIVNQSKLKIIKTLWSGQSLQNEGEIALYPAAVTHLDSFVNTPEGKIQITNKNVFECKKSFVDYGKSYFQNETKLSADRIELLSQNLTLENVDLIAQDHFLISESAQISLAGCAEFQAAELIAAGKITEGRLPGKDKTRTELLIKAKNIPLLNAECKVNEYKIFSDQSVNFGEAAEVKTDFLLLSSKNQTLNGDFDAKQILIKCQELNDVRYLKELNSNSITIHAEQDIRLVQPDADEVNGYVRSLNLIAPRVDLGLKIPTDIVKVYAGTFHQSNDMYIANCLYGDVKSYTLEDNAQIRGAAVVDLNAIDVDLGKNTSIQSSFFSCQSEKFTQSSSNQINAIVTNVRADSAYMEGQIDSEMIQLVNEDFVSFSDYTKLSAAQLSIDSGLVNEINGSIIADAIEITSNEDLIIQNDVDFNTTQSLRLTSKRNVTLAVAVAHDLGNVNNPAQPNGVFINAGGSVDLQEEVRTEQIFIHADEAVRVKSKQLELNNGGYIDGKDIEMQQCNLVSHDENPLTVFAQNTLTINNGQYKLKGNLNLAADQLSVNEIDLECVNLTTKVHTVADFSQTNIQTTEQISAEGGKYHFDKAHIESKNLITDLEECNFKESLIEVENDHLFTGGSFVLDHSEMYANNTMMDCKKVQLTEGAIFDVADKTSIKGAEVTVGGTLKVNNAFIEVPSFILENTGSITKTTFVDDSEIYTDKTRPIFSINTKDWIQYGTIKLNDHMVAIKANHKAMLLPSLNKEGNGLVYPALNAYSTSIISPIMVNLLAKWDIATTANCMSLISFDASLKSVWVNYNASLIGLDLSLSFLNPRKIGILASCLRHADFHPLIADLFTVDNARKAASLAVNTASFLMPLGAGKIVKLAWNGFNSVLAVPHLMESVKELATKGSLINWTDVIPLLVGTKSLALSAFNNVNATINTVNTVRMTQVLHERVSDMNAQTAENFAQVTASIVGPSSINEGLLSVQGPGATLGMATVSSNSFLSVKEGHLNVANTVANSSYGSYDGNENFSHNYFNESNYLFLNGGVHADKMAYIAAKDKLVLNHDQNFENFSIESADVEQNANITAKHGMFEVGHYKVNAHNTLKLTETKFESDDVLDVQGNVVLNQTALVTEKLNIEDKGVYLSHQSTTFARETHESKNGMILAVESDLMLVKGTLEGGLLADHSAIHGAELTTTATSHTTAQMSLIEFNSFTDGGQSKFVQDQINVAQYTVANTGKENLQECAITSKTYIDAGKVEGREVSIATTDLTVKTGGEFDLKRAEVDDKNLAIEEDGKASLSEASIKANEAHINGSLTMSGSDGTFKKMEEGKHGEWTLNESQAKTEYFHQSGTTTENESSLTVTHNHIIDDHGKLQSNDSLYTGHTLILEDTASQKADGSLIKVDNLTLTDKSSADEHDSRLEVEHTISGSRDTSLRLDSSEVKTADIHESGHLTTNNTIIEDSGSFVLDKDSVTDMQQTEVKSHDDLFEGKLTTDHVQVTAETTIEFEGHSNLETTNFIAHDVTMDATAVNHETNVYFHTSDTYTDKGSITTVGAGYDYIESDKNINLNDDTVIRGGADSATVLHSNDGNLRGTIETSVLQIYNNTLNSMDLLNGTGQYAHFQPLDHLSYETNRDLTITSFDRACGVGVTGRSVLVNGDCSSDRDLSFTTTVGDLTVRGNLFGNDSLSLVSAGNLYTGVGPSTFTPSKNTSFIPKSLTGLFKNVQTTRTPVEPVSYTYGSNGVVYIQSGGAFVNDQGNFNGFDIFVDVKHGDFVNNGGSFVALHDIGVKVEEGSLRNNTVTTTHTELETYSNVPYAKNFGNFFQPHYVQVSSTHVGQFIAGHDESFDVKYDFINHGGVIAANNIVQIKAGGSIITTSFRETITPPNSTYLSRAFPWYHPSATHTSYHDASIVGTEVLLDAGKDVDIEASIVAATEYVQIIAKNDVNIICDKEHYQGQYSQRTNYKPGQVIGGAGTEETQGTGVYIHAYHQVNNVASDIIGIGNVVVLGDEDVKMTLLQDPFIVYHHKSSSGLFGSNEKETTIWDWDRKDATVVSTNGHIYINSEQGGVNLVATKLLSNNGSSIYGRDYVRLYDAVLNREEYTSKSSWWGLSETDIHRNDQYSVPTVLLSQVPGVTILKSEGDITLRGAWVIDQGNVTMDGRSVNISVSTLKHELDIETSKFSLDVLGFDLMGGGKTNLSSLLKPDPIYASGQRLFDSNNALEATCNTINMMGPLINDINMLTYALQGNLLSAATTYALGPINTSVRLGYEKTTDTVTYETAGEGGVVAGNFTIIAKEDVTITGAPIIVNNDMDVTCENFALKDLELHQSYSHTDLNVGVSVTPYSGGYPTVDGSYQQTEMSGTTYQQQITSVGHDLTVHVKNDMTVQGAVDVGSFSGEIGNKLIIESQVSETHYTSWGVSASVGPSLANDNFSANYAHGSSETVTPASINSHTTITDEGEHALHVGGGIEVIGASLTSDESIQLSHTAIEARDIVTHSSSVSVGISGINFGQIANCFSDASPATLPQTGSNQPPGQLQTVNVDFGLHQTTQETHAVIGGKQGTDVNVQGHYVTDASNQVETTHETSLDLHLNVILPNAYNSEMISRAVNSIGFFAQGSVPSKLPDPAFEKLEKRLHASPEETMDKVKTASKLADLSYKDDYGAADAEKLGFETKEIATDEAHGGYAVLYENKETKEAYIVFRGTADEPALITDTYIAAGEKMPLVDNTEFDRAVRETADDLQAQGYSLYFDGHSLGGTLAEYYGSYYSNSTSFSFDNPGVPNGLCPNHDNNYSFQSPGDLINDRANFSTGTQPTNRIELPQTNSDILIETGLNIAATFVPVLAPIALLGTVGNRHMLGPIEERLDHLSEGMSEMQQNMACKM